MAYRPNQQAKMKFSRQKGNPTQTLWFDDRIPPLISINANKQKPNDKISIDSLNQSEVRSIYTVDKEELDRNTFDIFNKSFKSQKADKSERLNIKPATVEHQTGVKNFQTPILAKDFDVSIKEEQKTPIGQLDEFNEFQYKNCQAVKLYRALVEDHQKENAGREGTFEFQWFTSKNPAQLLANVLTNQSRLRLYIHYLLKEIHKNEQSRCINQIHEQNLNEYNPHLKEAYTNIICLLSKLVNRPNSQQRSKAQSLIDVSIFENGINIDIDPKCSLIKKRNNEKIRQLRHQATEQQTHLQDIKKLYEEIIQNYAVTIQNMNNNQQLSPNTYHLPLKQSRVHLQVEQDEVDVIRKKNHTFGMKQVSSRSSKQ